MTPAPVAEKNHRAEAPGSSSMSITNDASMLNDMKQFSTGLCYRELHTLIKNCLRGYQTLPTRTYNQHTFTCKRIKSLHLCLHIKAQSVATYHLGIGATKKKHPFENLPIVKVHTESSLN